MTSIARPLPFTTAGDRLIAASDGDPDQVYAVRVAAGKLEPISAMEPRFGVVADARLSSGVSVTGAAATMPVGWVLTSADVGKTIHLAKAGQTAFAGTILAVNPGTRVITLSSSPGWSGTQTGAMVAYGTDDTAALQAFIDDIPVNGAGYVPEGRYLFSHLDIPDNCRLIGDGCQHLSTDVFGSTQWAQESLLKGGTVLICTAVSGIGIDARLAAHGNNGGLNFHPERIMILGFGNASRTTIGIDAEVMGSSNWLDVQVCNFATGVLFNQVLYNRFTTLVTKGCYTGLDYGNSGQLAAGEACAANTFDQYQASKCEFGTVVDQSGYTVWIGGAWQGCTGTALKLQNATEDNTFIGSYFENVDADYAIDIDAAPNDDNTFINFHLGGAGDRVRCRGNRNKFFPGKKVAPNGAGAIDLSGGYENEWHGRDLGGSIISLGASNTRFGSKGSGNWGVHGGLITNTARQSECVRTVTKVANAALSEDDALVQADCTAGTITLTLPPAASHPGRRYTIKRTDGSGNSVIVDGNGGEAIDGTATKTLASQYAVLIIISTGSAWVIAGQVGTIT